MTEHIVVNPGGQLSGSVQVPGDKSISHRAVMFGSIANGVSEIHDCLMGDDVKATIRAFRALGVRIDEPEHNRITIHGRGADALQSPTAPIDLGNSGTSIRLLAGLFSSCGLNVELFGDRSLCSRPMRRVTDPLRRMGANITTSNDGTPPLNLTASGQLNAIRYELPMASAQVKSAVLLAGLGAQGETCVIESVATRDHTERMLDAFGVEIARDGDDICLRGGQTLKATSITVPGDISSAAFFLVGAAMTHGSVLEIKNVGINPTRTGVIDILRLMGADIVLSDERMAGNEPVADIQVRGARLRGIDIPAALIPSAIDEFPALFIAAASAQGTTRLREASELRHKESDRIDAMASGLKRLGVTIRIEGDGVEIDGKAGPFDGGQIDSRGDHRIAMSFAIAALNATAPIEIDDCAAIATSFPGFVAVARDAGLRIVAQ